MALMAKKSPSCSLLFFFSVIIFMACCKTDAQTKSNPTTDPSEVRALNSIFQQWGVQAGDYSWNYINGEPCSGIALNQSDSVFDDERNNLLIRCNCSFNSSTVCRITRLKVHALDKRGVISEELLALPYLTHLVIDRNFFSGPLPSFIGNMSRLESVSIAQNDFSGPIPEELGNLKQLHHLDLGTNNFSGTLPPELGNLVNLQILYISSSGLGGEIPETFANLENLEIVYASDNAFTGKIPDFIGNNWTKLNQLGFEGNSFEGPIPSSFANLTSLKILRIDSIYNGSSSLDFVRNLKNLTDLFLRNVLLTGDFPSYIIELHSLERLDLSFNNLTGQIPSTLFNMSSLKELYLGSNSLFGTLPSQKSVNLQTIDLSYNFLSGDLPTSWTNSRIDLNLVINNFTSNNTNIRLLPGLECLQRSFSCNRNPPRYASFAINCGGPHMISNGTEFEAENGTFGRAAFEVSSTQKWALSNVGMFNNPQLQIVENTSFLVTNTSTPQLYQTSRASPGSLRYYGLGLQNGLYTVHLLFVETVFPSRSTRTWRSLGRRIFDVYIQGTRKLRDFDISKEAGGVQVAVTRNFSVHVMENYLEIHLFWAGKGTCCTPELGYNGPLISAINVVPEFKPSVGGNSKDANRTTLVVVIAIAIAVTIIATVLVFVVIYVKRRKKEDEEVLLAIGPRRNTFSYSELKVATQDFSPSNKLGQGGFGPVFKGILSDGRVIAVKQLSVASHQGKDQFLTEIATISEVQHRNLVKLYGCCVEGNRCLLVYEYLENKSLDQALFGKNDLHLDWPTRFNICLSTARGLAYLHEESRLRIVHRDVKASNILLDAKLCPKISDFGLAKLYNDNESHISTRVAGTIGYLAPEYAMRGHLTEKADVFAFGVVALEILSGRPNSDNTLESDKIYLLEWAWTLHENNRSLGVMDPTLLEFDESEALRVSGVALLCTQASPKIRPPMSRVVAMLTGDIEVSNVTSKPSYLTDWDSKDITSTFTSEDAQTSIASSNTDIKY